MLLTASSTAPGCGSGGISLVSADERERRSTGLVDAQEDLRILPVRGIPEVRPGDDLAALLIDAAAACGTGIQQHDILVIAQKAVSKAEGCLVDLSTIEPSQFAVFWAEQWGKDPRHVEVVLRESSRVVKMGPGMLITETKHGFVCANSGVDASNVAGQDVLCLLPPDPDGSARGIRDAVRQRLGVEVAVIISDTFGRPWRDSHTNVAIGVAGMAPIRIRRAQRSVRLRAEGDHNRGCRRARRCC